MTLSGSLYVVCMQSTQSVLSFLYYILKIRKLVDLAGTSCSGVARDFAAQGGA